jgi:bacillithiol biosynthesis deacetylase BshB1
MFDNANFDCLAIGAHPDDVEIGCGGTMAKLARKGYKTAILTTTSAELSSRGDSNTRAQEFAEAAKILGVRCHKMLDIPDGHVRATQENKLKIVREIRELRPRVVFTHHWVARHPDHQHTSALVQEAVFLAGLAKIDTGQEPWRPYKIIYFANRYEFQPSFVVDISATFEAKMQAIRAYHSQFHAPDMENYGTVQTAISHPAFLDHIEIRARQYGIYTGVQYAEPFLVRENLAIDDPVALFGEKCWYTVP